MYRRHLYALKKGADPGWIFRTNPKSKWDEFKLNTKRFDPKLHDVSNCDICTVAKWTPIGKKNCSPNMKIKLYPKDEADNTVCKKSTSKQFCIKCKQETGRGIRHPCYSTSSKMNHVDLISKESKTGQEQVLSKTLKNLVKEK